MNQRPFISIAVLLAILFLPYWIYVPLLLIAIFITPLFWEGIILGFIIDVLYGREAHIGISWHFPTALAALLLVAAMIPLRRRLRMYV